MLNMFILEFNALCALCVEAVRSFILLQQFLYIKNIYYMYIVCACIK